MEDPVTHQARTDKWRQDNPEKYKEQLAKESAKLIKRRQLDPEYREDQNRKAREHYHANKKNNWERGLLFAAKTRAKKLGLEFDIELSDIVIPSHCPVLGVELIHAEGRAEATSASLDRIDPSKGYVKGNVQVMSRKANSMKHDANSAELLLFAKWIKVNYKEKTNDSTAL